MRQRFTLIIFALAFGFVCTTVTVRAQEVPQDPNDDDTARGVFLSSRQPTSGTGGSALLGANIGGANNAATGPKTTPASNSTGPGKTTSGKTTNGTKTTAGTKSTGTKTGTKTTAQNKGTNSSGTKSTGKTTTIYVARPIGLGYSIVMRDSTGFPLRVDPSRVFRTGEHIRVTLESNIDGFLYIFHTENDGSPEMIYPDYRLNAGDNRIGSHVPYEIPSSSEPEEQNRWFTFTGQRAIERLYIVISRDQLTSIPTGGQLVDLCQQNKALCPLRLAEPAWSEIKEAVKARVVASKLKVYGQRLESKDHERGIGLTQEDPEPSIVRMTAVDNAKLLVTAIDLVHN